MIAFETIGIHQAPPNTFLFSFFITHPDNATYMDILKHYEPNDLGVNSFQLSHDMAFPILMKSLLFCSYKANSTTCVDHGLNKTLSYTTTKEVSYLLYDNEARNSNLSSPEIEVKHPGYFTNLAAMKVHSEGLRFGVVPSLSLLEKELNKVKWKNVEVAILQEEGAIPTPALYNETISIANYIYTNSSYHTMVYVQVAPDNNPSFPYVIPYLLQLKDHINGTNYECTVCNVTELDNVFVAMGR